MEDDEDIGDDVHESSLEAGRTGSMSMTEHVIPDEEWMSKDLADGSPSDLIKDDGSSDNDTLIKFDVFEECFGGGGRFTFRVEVGHFKMACNLEAKSGE